MDIKEEIKFTNIDLENIYLKEGNVEYIDSIIYWLNERKKIGYTRLKPIKDGNTITLITIK